MQKKRKKNEEEPSNVMAKRKSRESEMRGR